jgi:hypothetical protein
MYAFTHHDIKKTHKNLELNFGWSTALAPAHCAHNKAATMAPNNSMETLLPGERSIELIHFGGVTLEVLSALCIGVWSVVLVLR